MTRAEARARGLARLRAAGDDTAALAADLLLAHSSGISKEQLYAHLDVGLSAGEARSYAELIERRAAGEPVAYLRGWKEFFGLRFAVDPRVLVPRPETETLVEAALAHLRARGGRRAADVGTGSGAIAIAIAVNAPDVRVIATDVSRGALEVARQNIKAHRLDDRVNLLEGDLLEPLEGEVNVVTANLPYLPAPAEPDAHSPRSLTERSLLFEPRVAVFAGGADGLDVIRRCADQLPARLAHGGAAFFECDPPQARAVADLLAARLGGPTRILRDLMGNERVVEALRP